MIKYLLQTKNVIPAWIVEIVKDNINIPDALLTLKAVDLIPYFVSSRSLINFEGFETGYPTSKLPKNYLDLFMSEKIKLHNKEGILSFVAHRCAARKYMLNEISAVNLFHMAVIDFRNFAAPTYFVEENKDLYCEIINIISEIVEDVYKMSIEELDNKCNFTDLSKTTIERIGPYLYPEKSDIKKIQKSRMLTNRAIIKEKYNPELTKTENAKLLGISVKTLNSHLDALGIVNKREHKVDKMLITKYFDPLKSIMKNYKIKEIQETKISYNTYYKAVLKLGLINPNKQNCRNSIEVPDDIEQCTGKYVSETFGTLFNDIEAPYHPETIEDKETITQTCPDAKMKPEMTRNPVEILSNPDNLMTGLDMKMNFGMGLCMPARNFAPDMSGALG